MATEDYTLPTPSTIVTTKAPKTPKAKGGTIKVETMSLNQFRSYLKGIMFVGGPTWKPDREQWEAIVSIIDKLTIDAPQQQPVANSVSYAIPQSNGWDQTNPSWSATPPPSPSRSAIEQSNEEGGSYQSPFV